MATQSKKKKINALSEFSRKVIAVIRKIPKGKVATYGQLAKLAGKPHAARGISWILHSCSESHALPWYRVLNAKGMISFPASTSSYRKQKSLLEKENVRFSETGVIDLSKFQWKKEARGARSPRRGPIMFG